MIFAVNQALPRPQPIHFAPYFVGVNSAGEITSETTADSSTWEGPVLVQQSDRIPVSAFAEQLQYEPEQEPERQARHPLICTPLGCCTPGMHHLLMSFRRRPHVHA